MRPGLALAGAMALSLNAAQAAPKSPALHVVGDEATGRWCAFGSKRLALAAEARLREAAISRDGSISDVLWGQAEIDPTGAVVGLTLGYGPDSGDWAVTDTYRLEDSKPVSLRRGIGYADGSPDHTETYARVGERLVLRSRSRDSRYTDMPVLTDLAREPYFPLLLQAARRSALPTTGLCTRSPIRRP